MERSHPLNSHSTELYCQCQSIKCIDHASSAVKCRLWSPLLEVLCKRNLMRNCQQRTGKQINGTQQCSQGRAMRTQTHTQKASTPPNKPEVGAAAKSFSCSVNAAVKIWFLSGKQDSNGITLHWFVLLLLLLRRLWFQCHLFVCLSVCLSAGLPKTGVARARKEGMTGSMHKWFVSIVS